VTIRRIFPGGPSKPANEHWPSIVGYIIIFIRHANEKRTNRFSKQIRCVVPCYQITTRTCYYLFATRKVERQSARGRQGRSTQCGQCTDQRIERIENMRRPSGRKERILKFERDGITDVLVIRLGPFPFSPLHYPCSIR